MGTGKLLIKVPETMRFRLEGRLQPGVMAKDIILHCIGEIGFDGATWTLLDRMIARGVMPNLGALRDRGIIKRPEDLGIDKRLATRDLLAARTIKDLVRASGGLYDPPKRFRNW